MTSPGTDLATTSEFSTGLEDFSSDDLRMPRLNIDHEKGVFKESLSGAEYPVLEIITLGMIKQRVLWPASVSDDGGDPLCKSPDNQQGFPNLDPKNTNGIFPWAATGWTAQMFQPNDEGRLVLPCQSCRLKEWKSHPDGKKTWCSEQHAIPLLYGPEGSEPGMTALFTTQRSSINASKAYFGSIVRRNLPAFAVQGRLTLTAQQRGKNTYYVPAFVEIGPTDQSNWQAYSESYRTIRAFITQPPRTKDEAAVDAGSVGQGNVINAQPSGFESNTWVPTQTPQPVQAQPVPAQQPVPQQWAQPAPASTQVLTPPIVHTPPAPQQTAPIQQQSQTARDMDDDLPF